MSITKHIIKCASVSIIALACANSASMAADYSPYYAQIPAQQETQYRAPRAQRASSRAAAQRPANAISLKTESGFEVGLQLSDYYYQENDVPTVKFMDQSGTKLGLTVALNAALSYDFFITGDLRFTYSENDYWSDPTGDVEDFAEDVMGEARLLVGRDFVSESKLVIPFAFSLSPYVGIGYRNLHNDSSDTVIGGISGYRRTSEYLYAPIGLTARFRVTDTSRISLNAEYDGLLQGNQKSNLSDVNPALPDVDNDQNSGRGVRGSAMFETKSWSVGPFIEYWNINQSDAGPVGYEPHNYTLEYGAQVRYRF